mmetsp:Transcript_82436/g.245855  ORF Transcript_82436/g.245855 Transcript_82436/m.245855 type:complete len:200 (-) Transcript_82436:803-1402(-)
MSGSEKRNKMHALFKPFFPGRPLAIMVALLTPMLWRCDFTSLARVLATSSQNAGGPVLAVAVCTSISNGTLNMETTLATSCSIASAASLDSNSATPGPSDTLRGMKAMLLRSSICPLRMSSFRFPLPSTCLMLMMASFTGAPPPFSAKPGLSMWSRRRLTSSARREASSRACPVSSRAFEAVRAASSAFSRQCSDCCRQ